MEITRGKIQKAKKVVIYGPEGIGKSTFAARFPGAVFIDTEGSTNDMDVARLPRPTSWNMLFDEIEYIKTHTDECRTLVIDTIDWAELLCVEHICAVHNKKGIEDFGYGNGYVYTKEEFGRFLNKLSDLIEVGINVVLTAHAQLRKFEQPDELGAYDRWELKLGKKTQSQTSPLVKEWADMLLFANYKTFYFCIKQNSRIFILWSSVFLNSLLNFLFPGHPSIIQDCFSITVFYHTEQCFIFPCFPYMKGKMISRQCYCAELVLNGYHALRLSWE